MDQIKPQSQETGVFYDQDGEPLRRVVGRGFSYSFKYPKLITMSDTPKPSPNKTGEPAGIDTVETTIGTVGKEDPAANITSNAAITG